MQSLDSDTASDIASPSDAASSATTGSAAQAAPGPAAASTPVTATAQPSDAAFTQPSAATPSASQTAATTAAGIVNAVVDVIADLVQVKPTAPASPLTPQQLAQAVPHQPAAATATAAHGVAAVPPQATAKSDMSSPAGAASGPSQESSNPATNSQSPAAANSSDGSAAQNPVQFSHVPNLPTQTGTSPAQSAAATTAAASTAPAAQTGTNAASAALQVGPAATAAQSPATPDLHALAVNIAAQSLAGGKQFNIRLDPPELGRVDVRLTVDSTGKAQAHLAVDKPQTLDLLQKDSGNLARALKESGVQLGNNSLQFSLKGQSRQSGGSQQKSRQLSVTAVTNGSANTAGATSSFYAGSSSGVDIRV